MKRTGQTGGYAKKARYVAPSQQIVPYQRPAAIRRVLANKETGFIDTGIANYALDTTGSIVLIPTITQGASVNQRVGKKVFLKSLQCRGVAFNNATASVNDCAMLIVYDKRPTGVVPAITDILVSANSQSFNNDANSGRFRILKRWDFVMLGPLTGVIATQQLTDCTAQEADFFLKLKNLPLVFKAAATGTIADIEEGALYLVTVGDHGAGTTASTLTANFRTRFVDV